MFRTELTIAPATDQLPRTARVLTMGSCFADSIGSRLVANKVEALVNPFGTVFQPLALARLLRAAAGEEVDWQQHLVEARGRWQSYDLHGSIGADSPVELLQTIQELVRRSGEFVRQADVVLLTLGTAWAYRLRETGELVNNCHKQPADLFVRELLTPDEIINGLAETHAYLRRVNPKLRFVLTVSPVRHLKDTLQLNAVSKSVLRLATHIVSDLLPGVAYFPAYELLVDDLRDYRFYASDMLHPSEVAENYIWEKFTRAYFDADFGHFRKEWAAVRQSLGHRPLYVGAPEHRQFLESTREKLEQLSLRKVDVAEELRTVRTQLAALPVPRRPEQAIEIEDDEERIDIGEGAATAVATSQPEVDAGSLAKGRPPRLSPEEFRAQRAERLGGRERGRSKGQQAQPTENEQFQTAAAATDDQAELLPFVDSSPPLDATTEQTIRPTTLTTALVALDLDAAITGEEPIKKKKRRSRGGAKRTARKNALRLAAGELLPQDNLGTTAEGTPDAVAPVAAEETRSVSAEGKKSTVIAKSVPVKRGGRRDEPGRVPRVALFATGQAAIGDEAPATADAEAPVLATSQAPIAEPATTATPDAQSPENDVAALVPAPPAQPRNNRNRKNRGAAKADATEVPIDNDSALAQPSELSAEAPEAPVPEAPGGETPTLLDNPAPASESLEKAPAPVSARQQRRSKARVISAARTEKPAIDTPIIPVPDQIRVRTQVAAGVMRGSSASLIAPMAQPKKAVATKKVAASAKKEPDVASETEMTPVAKTASPKPTAKPETANPGEAADIPVTPEPVARQAAKAAPTAKKTAAKKAEAADEPAAKPPTQKPTAKKVVKPAVAPEAPTPKTAAAKTAKAPATVKTSPAKAPAVKKPAAKPAAKSTAAKPKPPKKPDSPS